MPAGTARHVPPTSCPFSGVIHVEQLSANTMMHQFMEILAHQNSLNQCSVANSPYILYWEFRAHVINGTITCDM